MTGGVPNSGRVTAPARAGGAAGPMSHRQAYGVLGLVIVLWGINWPFMKIGLQSIGPMTFVVARMIMGGLSVAAYVAAFGRLHLPTRRDWPIVLSVGGLQMAAFLILTNFGLQHVDAGRSAILAYTTPLWVVPGAVLFLGERLDRGRIAGLAVGLTGVAVMFNPLSFDWTDRAVLIGNGLLMMGALVWALQIVQIRGHDWDSPPIELAPWQFLVGAVLVAPVAVILEWQRPIDWNWPLIGVLAFNGPIASGFCFAAAIAINRALPAITTSLAMLGVPVAGLLFSAALLGEPITWTKAGGLALIIGGVGLVLLADRRAAA